MCWEHLLLPLIIKKKQLTIQPPQRYKSPFVSKSGKRLQKQSSTKCDCICCALLDYVIGKLLTYIIVTKWLADGLASQENKAIFRGEHNSSMKRHRPCSVLAGVTLTNILLDFKIWENIILYPPLFIDSGNKVKLLKLNNFYIHNF